MYETFKQGIASWSDTEVANFFAWHKQQMLGETLNLCKSRQMQYNNIYDQHKPFFDSGYAHRNMFKNVSDWDPVITAGQNNALNLLADNPLAPSKIRKDGLACWDAAVGIPECTHRGNRVLYIKETPALRSCNSTWIGPMANALQRVGPLGKDRSIIRPRLMPWIVDLTTKPTELPQGWLPGWLILEAAHVMAHKHMAEIMQMAGSKYSRPKKNRSMLETHVQRFVAEFVVSMVYGLPINTKVRFNEGKRGWPDMGDLGNNMTYGIDIRSSSSFMLPYIRCSWKKPEAFYPDKTVAVISTGVFVEPHPQGFNDGTDSWNNSDIVCGLPTIVCISGWETVDVITHQPLTALKLDKASDDDNSYGMHPVDLMTPDTFWAYLALAKSMFGREPLVDPSQGYMYLEDWVKTNEYQELRARTPAWPCKDCYALNTKSDNLPRKPRYHASVPTPSELEKLSKQEVEDWQKYIAKMDRIYGIVQHAVIDFESRAIYGDRLECLQDRKSRKEKAEEYEQQIKAAYRKSDKGPSFSNMPKTTLLTPEQIKAMAV